MIAWLRQGRPPWPALVAEAGAEGIRLPEESLPEWPSPWICRPCPQIHQEKALRRE